MADRWLLQFPSGFGDLVRRALEVDFGPLRVDHRDDSAMVVRLDAAPDRVAALPYLRNAFLVRGEVPDVDPGQAVARAAKTFDSMERAPEQLLRVPQFRVMAQFGGQLTSLPGPSRARLEQAIERTDGGVVQTRGSGREYWLIGRRDADTTLLAMKLPKAADKRKPAAGELAPELAALLVRASAPEDRDVVLDPFAGSGALIRARAELPHRQLVANDLHTRPDPGRAKVRLLGVDGRGLPEIADGSVDVVITDPPWSEFDRPDVEPEEFAGHAIAMLDRVLHPVRGRAVLLLARQLEQTWADQLVAWGFEVDPGIGVLVNGHPASVLLVRRHRG